MISDNANRFHGSNSLEECLSGLTLELKASIRDANIQTFERSWARGHESWMIRATAVETVFPQRHVVEPAEIETNVAADYLMLRD